VIRKIVKDIVNGMQQAHRRDIFCSVDLKNVFLFGDLNSARVTAKIMQFGSAREDGTLMRKDVRGFGRDFLNLIAGMLYHAAKKRAGSKTPCSQTHDNAQVWYADACNIAENLNRIAKAVRNRDDPMTLEQVLQDQWINGRD